MARRLARSSAVLLMLVALAVGAPAGGPSPVLLGRANLVQVSGSLAAWTVYESGLEDLNGDSDRWDSVVHVFDAETGSVTNLGYAGTVLGIGGDLVLFGVDEYSQGADMNGDGDRADFVAVLYDRATGTSTNTRAVTTTYAYPPEVGRLVVLAGVNRLTPCIYDPSRNTVQILPIYGSWPRLAGDLALYTKSEVPAAIDLNGDGDTSDFFVVHVYDGSTGTTTNLGLAGYWVMKARGGPVAALVSEGSQGVRSLNGDGDALDTVLHIYDPLTATTRNTGIAVGNPAASWLPGAEFTADGATLLLMVPEAGQGGTDLNGDLDALDLVFHLLDPATGALTNLGTALAGIPMQQLANGAQVAFGVSEAAQGGRDLNGDGDALDSVLHVLDRRGGTVRNLGLAIGNGLFWGATDAKLLGLNVSEAAQAADLNGDGDTADSVLHVYDATTGQVTVRAGAWYDVRSKGNMFAGRRFEYIEDLDLNGDGDKTDGLVMLLVAGESNPRSFAGWPSMLELTREHVVFALSEYVDGTDLNGDGAADDPAVIHVHDVVTGQTSNLGLSAQLKLWTTDDLAAFPLHETWQQEDLNGDGRVADQLAFALDLLAPPPRLSPSAEPATLWPPDHRMVEVEVAAGAISPRALPLTYSATVSCNETEDGRSSPDWRVLGIDDATGIVRLELRAERNGSGNGRIYTVTVTATNRAGRRASASVDVTVPHDQGR